MQYSQINIIYWVLITLILVGITTGTILDIKDIHK
jgi:hypothetical protein